MMSIVNPSSSSNYRISRGPSGRDRISNIPDDVINYILSCLPLKDAVRTCVLSKNWESKWTFVSKVTVDCTTDYFCKYWDRASFSNFCETLLLQLQNVRNFHFSCSRLGKDEVSLVIAWVSSLLRRNIESLNLAVYENEDVVLPRTFLNCSSLRELVLTISCTLKVPVTSCFSNLKSLHLEGVKIVNEVSNTGTLIFTFPVLETFEVIRCTWLKMKVVEIYAPALTEFMSISQHEYEDFSLSNYSIKILGSKLAFFKTGGFPENILFTGSTVVAAELECIVLPSMSLAECGLQIRKLLRQLSSVKCLDILELLPAIVETRLGLPLPTFHLLEELYVSTSLYAEGLLELLHSAPSLKVLEIVVNNGDYFDYDEVEHVPSCISSHLKNINFYYMENTTESQYPLEKFLLKYGEQLERVSISGSYLLKNEIRDLLFTFPRGSTHLTFDVNSKTLFT